MVMERERLRSEESQKDSDSEDSISREIGSVVRCVVRSVVRHADRVDVRVGELDGRRTVILHTSPDDVPIVIGKQGVFIGLLRSILGKIASKNNTYVALDYVTDRETRGKFIAPLGRKC